MSSQYTSKYFSVQVFTWNRGVTLFTVDAVLTRPSGISKSKFWVEGAFSCFFFPPRQRLDIWRLWALWCIWIKVCIIISDVWIEKAKRMPPPQTQYFYSETQDGLLTFSKWCQINIKIHDCGDRFSRNWVFFGGSKSEVGNSELLEYYVQAINLIITLLLDE